MNPKVLIISRDSWNDTNNSGNTLSNLFQHWHQDEIAAIYCREEIPNNKICAQYFKISEGLLVKKILGKAKVAGVHQVFSEMPMAASADKNAVQNENKEKKIYDFFRKNRWHIFLWAREFLWSSGLWKSKELKNFIKDFNPDIIYFPTCDSFYMHNLLYYVAKVTPAKVVSFHCDDLVTFRQYSWSPWYWINRYILRKKMDKTIALSTKNYCIIDEQAKVYEAIYHQKFDLLYKTAEFSTKPKDKEIQSPIKIVYTGNVIYGRIQTIRDLAQVIKNINEQTLQIIFEIYTANPIEISVKEELESVPGVSLKGKVNYAEIPGILHSSDILLHVESFEKQQMLATSLSFSTKLVDYFEAGKPIFGIGWEQAASMQYLKANKLGFVASNGEQMQEQLEEILKNKSLLSGISKTVWEFGRQNHNKEIVLHTFESQLKVLVN